VREGLFEQADEVVPSDESGESVSFGAPRGAQPGGIGRATPALEL
jgi:hypothetical protein